MNLKTLFVALLLFVVSIVKTNAETYQLSTQNLSLVLETTNSGQVVYQYFGPKIQATDVQGLYNVHSNYNSNTYPAFGVDSYGEKAIAVEMPDGNMSIDLNLENIEYSKDATGQLIIMTFKDKVYPFLVKQIFKAWNETDIITTWTELTNNGKKDIKLLNFASAFIPLERANNYITQFHGS